MLFSCFWVNRGFIELIKVSVGVALAQRVSPLLGVHVVYLSLMFGERFCSIIGEFGQAFEEQITFMPGEGFGSGIGEFDQATEE